MINASKQNWSIGSMVKVGFMTLKVLEVSAIKDGMPDIYILENPKNGKRYEFIPHMGLKAKLKKGGVEKNMDEIIGRVIYLYVNGLITKEEAAGVIAKEYATLWARGKILRLVSDGKQSKNIGEVLT